MNPDQEIRGDIDPDYPDESFEHGQDIVTNDGVLLRRGPAIFLPEITNKTTGTLSLVHYARAQRNVLCIEWKPNDFLIADADSQENGDWSLVETIAKRRRTPSESAAFGPPPPPAAPAAARIPTASVLADHGPRLVRVNIVDLEWLAVSKKSHVLQLVRRNEQHSVVAEFFFQHGNAENYMRGLQSTHCVRRSAVRTDHYEIVENVEQDREKLQATFETLRIADIKGAGGGWLSSMVRDPFAQTMGLLARMSDAYGVLPMTMNQVVPDSADATAAFYSAAARSQRALLQQNRAAAIAGTNSDAQHSVHPVPLVAGRSRAISTCSSVGSPSSSVAAVIDEYDVVNQSTGAAASPPLPYAIETRCAAQESRLPRRRPVQRGPLLDEDRWAQFHADDGRIADVDAVREVIFRGGVEQKLRPEVWQYLLGYKRWDETHDQRRRTRAQKSSEYFKMKMQWLSMTAAQEKNFLGYQARKCQIEKDVLRTDRTIEYFEGADNKNVGKLQDILMTYVMYNFDLGYVQGMSDLLAPILAVMHDEVDSFWCFCGFMDMVYTNFDIDQGGMKHQLLDLAELFQFANPRLHAYFVQQQSDNMYVCFRWLLVWFKREFTYYDIMSLWEVMWTRLPCNNFPLIISLAILDEHIDTIMNGGFEFPEILKFVNELAYGLDFRAILCRAEEIYVQIKSALDLTDKVRKIIGEQPQAEDAAEDGVNGSTVGLQEEDLDGFDTIASPVKSLQEMQEEQRKIEEACQRSMYNSFY